MNNSIHYEDPELHYLDILNAMRNAGIEVALIRSLMEYCYHYEGLRDLMELWFEEEDTTERTNIIVDLQDALEDIVDTSPNIEERPYLRFNDLEDIRKDISQFKLRLREEVDRHGGITELARKTGIPQPSLSRFFSSSSMPRRTTLFRIAKALNLPESAIGFKWVR